MITTVCLNSNSRQFTDNCVAADISDLRDVEGNIIWADVTDPTSKDFEELAEEFVFHHLSIEDCQNAHQRPKIEEYPGYYFMVLYEAELVGPDQDLELRELNKEVHERLPGRGAERLLRGRAQRRVGRRVRPDGPGL